MRRVIVVAKAPIPGQVKTRMCPPCTTEQAALVAAAALRDTTDAVDATPRVRRVLVLDGRYPVPRGWWTAAQHGDGLGARLRDAFVDTHRAGEAALLIGMDTPQVTAALLDDALCRLARPDTDAVLGPAEDGGWWALGLRDPAHAAVLTGVPMSTPDTAARTFAALGERGLRIARLPTLRDVDTAFDALAVARRCPPGRRFPVAVAAHVPVVVPS
jgi:rSAM/selenodomain-associated transferase 1